MLDFPSPHTLHPFNQQILLALSLNISRRQIIFSIPIATSQCKPPPTLTGLLQFLFQWSLCSHLPSSVYSSHSSRVNIKNIQNLKSISHKILLLHVRSSMGPHLIVNKIQSPLHWSFHDLFLTALLTSFYSLSTSCSSHSTHKQPLWLVAYKRYNCGCVLIRYDLGEGVEIILV